MKTEKPDKNKQLMLDCGSKTGAYDIEAPDQWKWAMLHAKDPLEKAMAWVKSNTTAYKHESPFCVNDRRQPLNFRHLAADMGWENQTAQNVLCELQKQGRVKLKGKRIYYCADVPQAYEEPAVDLEQPQGEAPLQGRTISERIYSVQSRYGTYVADFIRKLPEEKQLQHLNEDEAWIPKKRALFADIMAATRMAVVDPTEDNMFLRWGIPKKRLPKRRVAELKPVQLQLVQEFYSVQSIESPCTKSPADFVDARAVVSTAAATRVEVPPPVSMPSSSAVLLNKKNQSSSSVRGVSTLGSGQPTTTTDLINPFKPKLRTWLERKFKSAIPGFPLDDRELDRIAATINTESHLSQFQKAANQQTEPRGWKVFVKIAESCQKEHAPNELAMGAGAGGAELTPEQAEMIRQASEKLSEERYGRKVSL